MKPIHMANPGLTKTVCGLTFKFPVMFNWLSYKDEHRTSVTCRRCQFGLEHGWGKLNGEKP